MRRFLLSIPFALQVLVGCSQSKVNVDNWRGDLRFLQKTVHNDYSFLFKKTTAHQFDSAVEKLYKEIPTMQEHEIVFGLARIVGLFQYGHTDVGWRHGSIKYHQVPLNLYWFSDGIYVEGTEKSYSQAIGARLIKVEGMPVDKALTAVRPMVPAENDQYFKAYGLDPLIVPEVLHAQGITKEMKNSITYTFEKDGKTFEQSFTAVNAFPLPREYGFVKQQDDWISVRIQDSTPNYLRTLDRIYYFEYMPAYKAVYLRHSQIQDDSQEDIPTFYKRVFEFIDKNDVERFVLDVRLNGGGNNYKNKPIVTGIIENKKINKPGKLFVIIGRRTFSACQNLVNELSNYTNALFVGEPTAENINFYGDNRRVELPHSKIPVYLSFAWWQDKPQWENAPWLAPQLAVDMSFDDYKSNRDPVLDACLNFSDKEVILDPMIYLRDLFMAGQLDKVETEAKRMVADPKYRYLNFEERFNRAGYDLMGRNQIESALYVFQLNTKLYPKSANAWDSLGEAFWKSNQKEKAIENYNKAIELDPKGATGENARRMLKQIQASK